MSPLATVILSDQPIIGALLAMLVELAGHRPQFPLPGELFDDVFQRAPFPQVALVDERNPVADSDLFHARAARRGVTVILFGAEQARERLRRIASSRGLAWVQLPVDSAILRRVLETAVAGRAGSERRQPRVMRTPEGDVIYEDREGGRWYVYDRRMRGDRRQVERGDAQRLFLNDLGEMRRCFLAASHVGHADTAPAEELERQLAGAERVQVEA